MKRVVWLLLIVLIAYAGCADNKREVPVITVGPTTSTWRPKGGGGPYVSLEVHRNVIAKWEMAFNRVKGELDRVKEELKQSELQLQLIKDEQIHLSDINKLLAELDKRYVDQLAEFDKRYVDQLAELDKRNVDQLAEFDKRYAERQQQWELRCQLQWQTTWWLWQVPWQWPLELQWQPLWYRCQWCVPVPEFTDIQKVESKPGPESPSKPEENEESDLEIPDLEIARQLAQSHFQEGKEAYDKGYFKQAISCFEKALKYEKFLTDTMRGEINKYKKMAQDNMKN